MARYENLIISFSPLYKTTIKKYPSIIRLRLYAAQPPSFKRRLERGVTYKG